MLLEVLRMVPAIVAEALNLDLCSCCVFDFARLDPEKNHIAISARMILVMRVFSPWQAAVDAGFGLTFLTPSRAGLT